VATLGQGGDKLKRSPSRKDMKAGWVGDAPKKTTLHSCFGFGLEFSYWFFMAVFGLAMGLGNRK